MAARNSFGKLIFLLLIGWHLVNESITPLREGKVIYRDYKCDSSNDTLQVIFTPGKLYIPEKVNEKKGLLPSESDYEILEVAGKKAILEKKS